MSKRVLVAYSSYFGNSTLAAETVERLLRERGNEVTRYSIRDGGKRPDRWDAIVVVTPIRMGMVVGPTRRFVRRLPRGGNARSALVVTHIAPVDENVRFNPVKPSRKLCERLKRHGYDAIGDPVFLSVVEHQGPLEEGYETKVARLVDAVVGE